MSGTHGLLQPNRPGYFFITLEESYVTLFKISADQWFDLHKNEEDAEKNRNARSAHAVAKAFITSVLVKLSNDLYAKTESELNLWVFLSFPQLEARLHGSVKIRTLKDAMKEMIEDGYVFKRPNSDPRYKALEYKLNLQKFRKELESLPFKPNKGESANLHDEIDNAKLPDVNANLHHDSANLHDVNANLHADNANLHPIRNLNITDKHNKEERKKETPTITQELPTPPRPEGSSLSLSQKNDSSFSLSPEELNPTKEANPTPVDYTLFDRLYQEKSCNANLRVARNEKNNAAIKELREQGASAEQVKFVFNDIWDDKDSFWQQHRGNPSIVASQFTSRVWKMTVPTEKRRTASGLTNWTEDKTVGVSAIVEPAKPASVPASTPTPEAKPVPVPVPAKPKEPALPGGYTRLRLDKPARPRTAWGRRQQEQKEM